MISVIASIRVKPGCREEFLTVLKANVPAVRAESGCFDYLPTVDIDAGLAAQELDGALVTLIERWESVAALQAHLATPHMLAYRERVKELVAGVSLKVLQEA